MPKLAEAARAGVLRGGLVLHFHTAPGPLVPVVSKFSAILFVKKSFLSRMAPLW